MPRATLGQSRPRNADRLGAILNRTLALALIAFATPATAADIGVLVVGDSAQYVDAARSAHAALGAGAELTVLSPEARLPEAWRASPPRVIVAIGARAVRVALASTSARVIAAMVLQESPELSNRRVVAVPVAAPIEKQLALLKRLAPRAKRIGIAVDPAHSSAAVAEAKLAATKNGQTLVLVEVTSQADAPAAFAKLRKEADAIVLLADTTVVRRETLDALVRASLEGTLPVIGYSAAVVQSGLLAGYAVDPEENGRVAAGLARAAVAGGVAEVERPVGKLHVNAKAARALGIALPPDLVDSRAVVFDPR